MLKNISLTKTIGILILNYCLIFTTSFALEVDLKNSRMNSIEKTSEFVFQSYPNQQLIPVRLIGEVKKAGLYYIPSEMKLITLISLAGGTTSDANLEKIAISNDTGPVLNEQGNPTPGLNVNIEETVKNGAKNDYTLKANDIVLVEAKKPFISSDSFRIITVLSLLLTTALTAITIKDKL